MYDIRFAIVGCGRVAERHAEIIHKTGVLKAVCDTDFKKALNIADKYNAAAYKDLDDLLLHTEEIDVICVCTPNGLHAEHSIKALEAGFNVLCEKPMSTSVVDGWNMIRAAEKAGKYLFIIKQNRFNPPVVAVKDAVEKGFLGKIYSIQINCFWNRNADYYKNLWKGTQDLDGGTLYTQFSHFIDLLYWIVGDVKNVHAFTGNFAHRGIIDFEDTGVVILEFINGTLGTINYTVNSFDKNIEGSFTILGEKGTVKIGGEYLNTLEYQNIKDFEIKLNGERNFVENDGSYTRAMSNHDKVYENLITVLTNGTAVSTNAFESLKTVEIINKIYESAKQNRV